MTTADQHTDLERLGPTTDPGREGHAEPGAGAVHDADHHDTDYRDTRRDDATHPDADHAEPTAPDQPDAAFGDGSVDGIDDRVEHRTDGTSGVPAPDGYGSDRGVPAGRTDPSGTDSEGRERLVPQDRADAYGARWDAAKGTFVDEPRQAVAEADQLVGELLDELQELFRKQRQSLEHGLDADETSTEDLRLALRRYRSFFDRLLSF